MSERKDKFPVELPAWMRECFPGEWVRLRTVWACETVLTPKVADMLLKERNNRNRGVVRANLNYLIDQIEEGHFAITGQTCIFDLNGDIADMQHRCQAVVTTCITIPVIVVFGVDPASFENIDQGAKRTIAHAFDVDREANTTALGAALFQTLAFFATGRAHRIGNRINGKKLSASRARAELKNHPGLRDSVSFIRTQVEGEQIRTAVKPFGGPSVAACLHYVFSQVNSDLADEFFTRLALNRHGDDSRWNPIRLLRLAADKGGTRVLTPEVASAILIKAWNRVYDRQPISQLKWGTHESYPQVAGWEYDGDLPKSVARLTA